MNRQLLNLRILVSIPLAWAHSATHRAIAYPAVRPIAMVKVKKMKKGSANESLPFGHGLWLGSESVN
jgi:hypothetical protein